MSLREFSNSQIERIDVAAAVYGSGRPIPEAEARERLAAEFIVPNDGYLAFIGRWGGCYVGVSVHAWDQSSLLGTTRCLELTARARDDFGEIRCGCAEIAMPSLLSRGGG